MLDRDYGCLNSFHEKFIPEVANVDGKLNMSEIRPTFLNNKMIAYMYNCLRCSEIEIKRFHSLNCKSNMTYKMFYMRVGVLCILMPTGFFMISRSKFYKMPYPLFAWALLVEATNFYCMISQQVFYSTGLTNITFWPLQPPLLPHMRDTINAY